MRTGSHKNAFFRGEYKMEFAWFSLAAANPFASMSADRAARKIVNAIRNGKSEITITFAAWLLVVLQSLFPNFIAFALKLISRLLPGMPVEGGRVARTGWRSESKISPSILTWLADRATQRLNGISNSQKPERTGVRRGIQDSLVSISEPQGNPQKEAKRRV
jgi:hypothetical protein